jgi:hypothetical protein
MFLDTFAEVTLHSFCHMDVEKLGGKEGELWLLVVLVGQNSLYLQLLRCLVSRDKSGVATLCSVMVEMSSSHLGLYGPGLGRAGQEDTYATVTYTTSRICILSYYILTLLITQHTILNGN